jgi:hypothetical protein
VSSMGMAVTITLVVCTGLFGKNVALRISSRHSGAIAHIEQALQAFSGLLLVSLLWARYCLPHLFGIRSFEPAVRHVPKDSAAGQFGTDHGFKRFLVAESWSVPYYLPIADHPDQKKYPGQRIYFVIVENSIFLVPHVVEKEYIFLKTIIPCKKATKDYIKEKEEIS